MVVKAVHVCEWLKHLLNYLCILGMLNKLNKQCQIQHNVTGFVIINPNHTRTEIHFIANQLKLNSCTTQKCLTHGYGWPSLLSQTAFCHPIQTTKVHYRVFGVRPGLLCSNFYLLCFWAMLKIKVTYYAQYYAHNYCNYIYATVYIQFYDF